MGSIDHFGVLGRGLLDTPAEQVQWDQRGINRSERTRCIEVLGPLLDANLMGGRKGGEKAESGIDGASVRVRARRTAHACARERKRYTCGKRNDRARQRRSTCHGTPTSGGRHAQERQAIEIWCECAQRRGNARTWRRGKMLAWAMVIFWTRPHCVAAVGERLRCTPALPRTVISVQSMLRR